MTSKGKTGPVTSQEDRAYLGLSISDYKHFVRAIENKCFLNKQKDLVFINSAKTKHLRNREFSIRKNPFLMKSLIWREQLRLIRKELRKRNKKVGDL